MDDGQDPLGMNGVRNALQVGLTDLFNVDPSLLELGKYLPVVRISQESSKHSHQIDSHGGVEGLLQSSPSFEDEFTLSFPDFLLRE
jgi:hypothetical protein